ncbi:ricin-type beta-trefoil lectin domain protein [Streptomyces erythrochromogenes]|uniref:ricin-type beta-trefoil lectin domain protein n=1 Tax=Streptomyces erythrochromogenes TaxID=285574 RepID=UPI003320EC0B
MRAFSVKGTAQAPDLSGFTDPAAGPVIGKIDPIAHPRIGSDGDLTGDGLPDLWAVDANRQLLAFNGTGTTPSAVGNFPATATGVTWPTATIDGRSTNYAAFDGPSSAISTPSPVIDTRKSFTISTSVMATKAGGVVLGQGPKGNTSLLLFPNHHTNTWEFSLGNPSAAGRPYDTTAQTNSAARIAFGTWTRLTAVYDHTTGQMRLYVNGTLAGTGHHSASAGQAPAGPLTLGRFQEGEATSGLTGGISNPAVYPYAASVTATEAVSPINLTAAAGNCVDNDGNSTDDGNRIQIYACNGSDAQKFQIRDDGTIINPVSGRCLDLGNTDTTPGRQLWLWDCNDSTAQRWSVPILGTAPLPVPAPVPVP